MAFSVSLLLGGLLIFLGIGAVVIILIVLVIRALLKYIRSGSVRKEKEMITKSLGEALKENRTRCKMTQEFVAESIGVSRQAVSKWESGVSDPSTSNLLAIAKLYDISAEELLKEVQ
ncbi:HTH-type transcriptional regulator ImmR [Anaerotignum neopropionicum]|uniref:HTH-type transcriptional regulator ImmR n=1 Tax=Anaerotignum neopropionicum TaxID=36847 RepID=A0A136WEU1_9FIRM|nr:helix-turn-helix transcriptional regulator [Anaerotignum neopropionicum]KXL53020.1 HTH-type transcriptional regulator ImmR [Anaerotignum neopropionicum]